MTDKPEVEEGYQSGPKQPYQIQFEAQIAAEYAEIAAMRDEEGKELPNKRTKKLQQGVQLKYKKMFAEQNAVKVEKKVREFVPITENMSLPAAPRIHLTKPEIERSASTRVQVFGWCHRVRVQSQKLAFLTLRDGHGFVQVMLDARCMGCEEASRLNRETAVMVKGVLSASDKSPTGYEIQADFWELVGESAGDFENLVQPESGPDVRSRNRHVVHRGDRGAAILKLRSAILGLFREHFASKDFTEVNPPTIVNTECEGGANLFKLDYYGETAFMTQSSQLYIESVIQAVGDVFCIAPSYRAERANTRRHLAEFTHLETEHAFITFEQLLEIIEGMVSFVANNLYERHQDLLKQVTETPIKNLKTPFKRMTYLEALDWLNARGIKNEGGEDFKFGDDIAESQERQMIDTIGEPVFLCKFPASLKSFYMPKCKEDDRLTESVDLLVPTVGEIVGGSMRVWKFEETMAAYARENIPTENYYWYTDVRKYGANPHGGCGLGLDRFVCWLLGIYNIRDSVLYPRAYGQLMP
ncbi:Asparaginyl-tRNA_synthetase [Hexamita inflata]|uniref:asparagine--tRNA ligase n=1 Tax=Hexamita inflata TaxID=28002 RepID=A0AA86Q6P9_9EUKA|nr:Asparaginyl-tRNA synthetase [Hexamita inflata]